MKRAASLFVLSVLATSSVQANLNGDGEKSKDAATGAIAGAGKTLGGKTVDDIIADTKKKEEELKNSIKPLTAEEKTALKTAQKNKEDAEKQADTAATTSFATAKEACEKGDKGATFKTCMENAKKAAADAMLGAGKSYDSLTPAQKAAADAEFDRKKKEADNAKVATALEGLGKDATAEQRKEAGINAFKTSDAAKDADGNELTGKALDMAYEKAKRDGAKGSVKTAQDACRAAVKAGTKTKQDCKDEADKAYFDSLGIEPDKAALADKAAAAEIRKAAAAEDVLSSATRCNEAAAGDASKLAECDKEARSEAAEALGEAKDYTAMSDAEKANFDAKFDRMTKEARGKELADAMRANKGQTKEVREAAALDIFKKSQTKTYTDDEAGKKDAKMDFEKAKRDGAKAGLADTIKDCKTAGKSEAECKADGEIAFAESMGLDKNAGDFKAKYELFKKDAAASAAVKKTSACKEEAGANAADCAELAKKEAAKALGGDDYDDIKKDAAKKAAFDAKFDRMTREAGAKELAEAMRANKDIADVSKREAAALDIFKKSQTKTYTDDEAGKKNAKMDFEKAKRDGAKAGLADTIKDCKTAGKDDCEAVAETVFAESMGLTKGTGDEALDFKAKYERFKKDAAASAAVKKTSACKEEAGANAADCATLAKKEAAKALGEAKDYADMSGAEKVMFDIKFDRMAKEAGAKELADAMRANKGQTKEVREAAALGIFKKSQTKTYTDDEAGKKDAKMDFEKAKRDGAKAGIADTMKDCKAAGKTDCDADSRAALSEALGLEDGEKDSDTFKVKYERYKKESAATAATDALKERVKAMKGALIGDAKLTDDNIKDEAEKYLKESLGLAADAVMPKMDREKHLSKMAEREATSELDACVSTAADTDAKKACLTSAREAASTAMGRAEPISKLEFQDKVLANANKERAAEVVAEATAAKLDKTERVKRVKDAIQKLNPDKKISDTKARRFIEQGAVAAVKDAFEAVDAAASGKTAKQKDELLKDAIAEATGKDVSELKRKDVQKYRKQAAVDKMAATFSDCKGAGVTDCAVNAKEALKKSLGRTTDVTPTELARYRRKAARAKVASLKSACVDTNTDDNACKTELKAKIKELTGKDVDETGLQKIVRKGAEGAAREFMSSCGGAAREDYEASSKDDTAKKALRAALKACRTGDVKEGLQEALGDKDGSGITEEDIIEFTKEGIGSHAATVMDACVEAAAGEGAELTKCASVETLKETLIEASGNPLVEADEAVELKRQLAADAFMEAQEAANDAATGLTGSDDAAKVKAAQDEAKALFKAQTGQDLDVMDATEVKQDAVASSIADAARACADAGSDCTDADAVVDKAADTASGDMPAVKAAAVQGGRRLADVTKDSTKDEKKNAAKRMREKKSGALKAIKERVDACLEAGKDDATIKACRDDDKVKKVREKIRPARKEKADNREQRAKAAIDALADCKRAGSTGCEDKAKKKAKKLFPKKEAKADGGRRLAEDEETEEPWESMKGKRKKERMRRAVQDCDKGKEATCAKAAKDDLKKDLDVDEKEIAMIKRQAAPMMAADEIAECEDAINGDTTKSIDTVDKDCEALGKDLFMATGSTAEAWEKRKARVLKLAKARFAGKDSDVKVNTKQVDTFFEADAVAGKCDGDMVEQARNDVGNAAMKGDKEGKGETVVKSQGVDSATKKCRVVFATKVSEGKHIEAAAEINKAKEVGKKKKSKASGSGSGRMLRNLEDDAEGSVSSSPTSEEVPAGSSAESTDFSEGGVTKVSEGDSEGEAETSGAVKNSWAGAGLTVAVAVAVFSAALQW